MDGDTLGRVTYLVLLLAALGGWVMVEYRQRLGLALRTAMAWGMIFIGVMAGYGLWQDVRKDIMPSQTVTDAGTVELPRAEDGHYYAMLKINGTPVQFMVDTGASAMVLSRDDAKSLGIAPDSLVYLGQSSTANGVVRTARVTLPVVEFGPFTTHDFGADVNDGEMDGSLLGMEYLGQFNVQIADEKMILSK